MRLGNDGPPDALAMFSVATVFILLASLIAAAGFAVVAQRRLRHLGMLAAIGATQKHLRLVLITNGAIVGAIAALLRDAHRPRAVGRRSPRCSSLRSTIASTGSAFPWLLIALTVLLALLGAIAAAWWPGRTVARLPVTLALSGRPPKPRPARHSAIAAAALIAVGIGCLATVKPRQAAAHRRRDRGDDHRLPAPRPAGDPRLLRPRRASLHRTPIGASRPRSLSGPFRSGARRGHPRPRHRSDGRHHRLCRGGEESG